MLLFAGFSNTGGLCAELVPSSYTEVMEDERTSEGPSTDTVVGK